MSDIMLDLETLSTSTKAAVISFGAVSFDPNGEDMWQTFHRAITMESVETFQVNDCQRHVSPVTVGWWMQQSPEAQRGSFANSAAISTMQALDEFVAFVRGYGPDVRIWGNGAAFDNVIMASLLSDMGFTVPWRFSNDRCYRTLKNVGIGPATPTRVGTHHNPLDDAVTQAAHLQQILKAMKEGQTSVKSFS
jgi:xanthine/CO dehydrogenase XdhC/CoxF family maturation factor